jgi:hypothetical protein
VVVEIIMSSISDACFEGFSNLSTEELVEGWWDPEEQETRQKTPSPKSYVKPLIDWI